MCVYGRGISPWKVTKAHQLPRQAAVFGLNNATPLSSTRPRLRTPWRAMASQRLGWRRVFHAGSGSSMSWEILSSGFLWSMLSGWWFEPPLWKILVNWDDYSKPPTSWTWFSLIFHMIIAWEISREQSYAYPLVNGHNELEHHHVDRENLRCLWPFSIAMLVITRG